MNLLRPVLWLVALLAVLFALSFMSRQIMPAAQPILPVRIASRASVPPALTSREQAYIATGTHVDFLVSYTASGFQPLVLTVKKGSTVRFANNASEALWVAASGAELYPGTQNECGSSALDSCGPIKPGGFWQFTFTHAGTWQYYNNLNKTRSATIIVE